MSKKVCVCGTNHGKDKPLIITITACKNKCQTHALKADSNSKKEGTPKKESVSKRESMGVKNSLGKRESLPTRESIPTRESTTKRDSKKGSLPGTPAPTPTNLSQTSVPVAARKSSGTKSLASGRKSSASKSADSGEDEEPLDHLLYCEEEDLEPPLRIPKGQGEPVSTHQSIGCDLDQMDLERVKEMFTQMNKNDFDNPRVSKEEVVGQPLNVSVGSSHPIDQRPSADKPRGTGDMGRKKSHERRMSWGSVDERTIKGEEHGWDKDSEIEGLIGPRVNLNQVNAQTSKMGTGDVKRESLLGSQRPLVSESTPASQRSTVSGHKSQDQVHKYSLDETSDGQMEVLEKPHSFTRLPRDSIWIHKSRQSVSSVNQDDNQTKEFHPMSCCYPSKEHTIDDAFNDHLNPPRSSRPYDKDSVKSITYAREQINKEGQPKSNKKDHRKSKKHSTACNTDPPPRTSAGDQVDFSSTVSLIKPTQSNSRCGTSDAEPNLKKAKEMETETDVNMRDRYLPAFPVKQSSSHGFQPKRSHKTIMLPVITPRFHGPGCTMEVNVLEKHDTICRYKKANNPKRSSTDDKSGSYEVIGRIVFKTCEHNSPSISNSNHEQPNNANVMQIYSIFNIRHDIGKDNLSKARISPNSVDTKIEELQKYIRHHKVLESLAKSCKSFPSHADRKPSKSDELMDMDCNLNNRCCEPRCCCAPSTSYDVEELYSAKMRSNKSVQITGEYRNRGRLKKWFHVLFSCVLEKDSLGDISLDSEFSVDYALQETYKV